MISTGTDDLLRLARERADFLEAEVRQLRAERSAMLDVIEAAEATVEAYDQAERDGPNEPDWSRPMIDMVLRSKLDRVRTLIGDGGDCRECPPMGEPCSSCTR